MGCDIHIITEIKKDDKWVYVPEVPKSLNNRNYYIFGVLANVRKSYDTYSFEQKGLPKDISGYKYNWNSNMNYIKNLYNESKVTKYKTPDGKYYDIMADEIYSIIDEKDLKSKHVKMCKLQDGKIKVLREDVLAQELKVNELYTFEEYLNLFEDEYDEDAKDYGYYDIDFTSCDYHSHSYLTLKELKTIKDKFKKSKQIYVSEEFIEAFYDLGGELPPGMSFDGDGIVNINIEDKYEINSQEQILKGIKQLKKIKKKYNIEKDKDIRIVFAFDS